MASRMGCVTGLDLASHCRLLLHSRPKHTLLWRWLALYPLYLLSEVAIIATDLAELLGSAIALCLLFPSLELWQGVLITGFDVVILLALGDPLRGTPVRMFEWLIGAMVIAVFICMCVIISRVDIHWGTAFQGYLPSNIFLGSALATQDRVSTAHRSAFPEVRTPQSNSSDVDSDDKKSEVETPTTPKSLGQHLKTCSHHLWTCTCDAFKVPPPSSYATVAKRHSERENNSILILASAIFFYGNGLTGENAGKDAAGLFDAYDLIKDLVGPGKPSFPSPSAECIDLCGHTVRHRAISSWAGQAVAEGFLQWRVSPVIRRLLTRLLAVIPSMAVAIAMGRAGIDMLLVLSQVVLSIVLPFITLPLIYVTSSKELMSVRVPAKGEESGETTKDFSNNWFSTVIASGIWLLVAIANVYVLSTLGKE
ncbi:putative transporter of the nramp family [Moniliophthora roreri]|nr:putative transporter of the nramp family [Moniliophthora roreri]